MDQGLFLKLYTDIKSRYSFILFQVNKSQLGLPIINRQGTG